MRRRRQTIVVLQLVLAASLSFFVYFAILSSSRAVSKNHYDEDLTNGSHSESLTRQAHLFDNECKFAWTEPLDSSLQKRLQFPKRSSCERYNKDLFKRYPATGEFSLKTKNYTGKLDCMAQVLKGALRPDAWSYQLGKTQTFIPKLNKRFWINADNFMIICFTGQLIIYRKQFMGFKMSENLKLVVESPLEIPGPRLDLKTSDSTQFSVSILGLDSTSRAQFKRHMRKTVDLMDRMGFVTFESYNKVGDNSAVNLLPILADELVETQNMSRLDATGDVNLNKILPSKTPLDPDKIEWIWKQLPPEYITMFNDDVMHTSRGLFHYPPENFHEGFGEAPARFYYRPYYNHLYSQLSNWWRKCLDGELLAEVFMDSWFRFERMFSKIPHFGFSFISSLTHDDPSNLELLDHSLYHRLAYLNRTECLENTILIVLGDHGNRVHPINRYTFAGKIEERAPFLSIFVPPRFRRMFPDKYKTLKENSQRFISNFDLHATLKSIMTSENGKVKSRGTSLFEPQDTGKSCQDNGVISNHCLCMVDASQDFKKVPDSSHLVNVLGEYLMKHFDDCFVIETLNCENITETLMPNSYVQVWARTKISDSEMRKKKNKASAIIYPYMTCHVESKSGENLDLLAQFRLVQATQLATVVYPPQIRAPPGPFSYFSFPMDYCKSVDLYLAG